MRIPILCGFLALFLSGCLMAPSIEEIEAMMAKPERPAELNMLDKMAGTWEMTGEMVTPMPREMAARLEAESGEPPETMAMKAQTTMSWCLDNMFMKSEGWHEMPDGERMRFNEFITWDARKGKFHSWWFSNWGETGEGWMSFAADGQSCTMQARGMTADGTKKSYKGTFTFVDDDTMTWTFTEHGPMGPMTMKGTSKRK